MTQPGAPVRSLHALHVLLAVACWVAPAARAELHGLIVRGLAGSASIEQDHAAQEAAWVGSLSARGAAAEGVAVVAPAGPDDRAVAERTLTHLADWGASLGAGDEAVLVLLGQGRSSRRGWVFDVRGPRLSGDALAAAVDALRGVRVTVVLPGAGGGPMAERLAAPGRSVLSATDHPRQLNHPRFGGRLAELLARRPAASLAELAAGANQRIEDFYRDAKLVRTETAALWVDGERVDLAAGAGTPAAADARPEQPLELPPGLLAPAEGARHRIRRHTPEEAESLSAASAAAADPAAGTHATVLQRVVTLALEPDGSAVWSETATVLARHPAAHRVIDGGWRAKPTGGSSGPPRLKDLRVVRADGFTLAWDHQAPPPVPLPGVAAGSLVFLDFEVVTPKPPLPAYGGSVALTLPDADVASQVVRVTHARGQALAARAVGGSWAEEEEGGPGFRSRTWTIGPLPAREAGGASPPPEIELSGFESWNDIAGFYQSMARDAAGDPAPVAAAAEAWTPDAASTFKRVVALYDRVNAMPYFSRPLGVGGLRPEPADEVLATGAADCKGKAHLLVGLLAAVGVHAEVVLVDRGAGPPRVDPAFPAWGFNHAMVRVPDPGDGGGPLWLDPTDGVSPAGLLTGDVAGRPALVLAEDVFVATPPAIRGLAAGGADARSTGLPTSTCVSAFSVSADRGLRGTVSLTVRGHEALGFRQAERAAPGGAARLAAERMRAVWPDADVGDAVGQAGDAGVFTAEVSFPLALVKMNEEQTLLRLPPPFWPAAPRGGVPEAHEERLTVSLPAGSERLNTPAGFAADAPGRSWDVDAAGPLTRTTRVASTGRRLPEAAEGDATLDADRRFHAAATRPWLLSLSPPAEPKP